MVKLPILCFFGHNNKIDILMTKNINSCFFT